MINWKKHCKTQYDSSKYYEKRDEQVTDLINILADEFSKEDELNIFSSKELRNITAEYCVSAHGAQGNWLPSWKNDLYLYRKKKDLTKLFNSIFYPNRKRQNLINIGFTILAIHYIYTLLTS